MAGVTPTKQKQIRKAEAALLAQQEWMRSRGLNLAGYVKTYGSRTQMTHSGDGGEAIYAADLSELKERRSVYKALVGRALLPEEEWVIQVRGDLDEQERFRAEERMAELHELITETWASDEDVEEAERLQARLQNGDLRYYLGRDRPGSSKDPAAARGYRTSRAARTAASGAGFDMAQVRVMVRAKAMIWHLPKEKFEALPRTIEALAGYC